MSEPKRPSTPPKNPDAIEERPSGLPPANSHAVAEAVAASGAVVGALVGAVGGPIGAVAGGAIGAAIGAIAGATIEKTEHEHEMHERELDDEIGVTSGSLGVPAEAKRPSREALEEAKQYDDEHKK